MKVQIIDADPMMMADDLIGEGVIELSKYLYNNERKEKIKVQLHYNKKTAGILEVMIQFKKKRLADKKEYPKGTIFV